VEKEDTKKETSKENYDLRILMALRRIMHFIDSYSRKLAVEHHITGPQLICLYSIVTEGPLTLSDLRKRVSLSMSTVNGIVDRLENKQLIIRERKDKDRRKVLISATDEGINLASSAPPPLQDRLSQAIANLPELEQVSIALSLERIVEMMEEKT
jgi:DNA-binding MarR family transcriptional regulator